MDNSQPNKDKSSLPAQDAHFQPVYAMPPHYADDEISLVDLAKILIRRKVTMLLTFAFIVITAAFFAWQKSTSGKGAVTVNKTAYQTLIAVGYKDTRAFIEPLDSIKTQLDVAFIPAAEKSRGIGGVTKVKYTERKNVNEDGSNLVSLITVINDSEVSQDEVATFHKLILEPLLKRHDSLIRQVKLQLDQKGDFVYQPIATDIAALAVPVSAGSKSKSKLTPSVILALGILLGVIMGIMAAFIKEFASRVKQSLEEDRLSKV
ncbi:hypothetical protein ABMA58_14080 [Oceanospirillum sp. HFRX-1_2]